MFVPLRAELANPCISSQVYVYKNKFIYPSDKPRSKFTEYLDVKVSQSWIQLVSNEEVIDNIA